MELLNKKEAKSKDMEISKAIPITKNEKACSVHNTKCAAKQLFDKEISMDMNRKFNPPPQRKSGRDGIIPAEILPRPSIEKKR